MYKPYKPTEHAEQRRLEMGVGTKEIKRALNEPEVTYPSGAGHPPGRMVHLHGRICVIVDNASGEVVTILWRGIEFERPSALAITPP